jgi:hypothetical protein
MEPLGQTSMGGLDLPLVRTTKEAEDSVGVFVVLGSSHRRRERPSGLRFRPARRAP